MAKSQYDLIEELTEAASNGDLELVKELVEKVKDIDARDGEEDNALSAAASNGQTSVVRYLIEKGADIDDADENGNTALILAAHGGHTGTVQYLLEQSADIEARDEDGQTALDVAKNQEHEETAELIEKADEIRNTVEWSLLGSSKLVHIEASITSGRRLTEIFDFEARRSILTTENIRSNEETTLAPTSFNELPEQTLKNLFDKFTKLGGKADETFVLKGSTQLDKGGAVLTASKAGKKEKRTPAASKAGK